MCLGGFRRGSGRLPGFWLISVLEASVQGDVETAFISKTRLRKECGGLLLMEEILASLDRSNSQE